MVNPQIKSWKRFLHLIFFLIFVLESSTNGFEMCQGNRKRDITTMVTYSHATTPLGQSERAYYLSYFIKSSGHLLNNPRQNDLQTEFLMTRVSVIHVLFNSCTLRKKKKEIFNN